MASTASFPVLDPMLGRALFSTCNCHYDPRWAPWPPRKSVIIRSDPEDDMKSMALRLQEQFPEICKTVVGPIQPQQVYEYFDHNDADFHGFSFLITVLERIALFNRNYVCNVEDFVKRWMATNAEAFTLIEVNHEVEHLFQQEDIEEYGAAFLSDAMTRIKAMRVEHDEQEQDLLYVQQQYTQMNQYHGVFFRSTVPATGPFPRDPLQQPGRRISNPERPPPYLRDGSIRQFPAPEDRILASSILLNPQLQAPRQRDSHSDPVPILGQIVPEYFMGVPSRGVPSPYTYRTLPVPVDSQRGAYPSRMPKSKKNPMKKSSDDARLHLITKPGRTELSHQPSSAPLPPVWSTEPIQTTNQLMSHVHYITEGPERYGKGHDYPSRHVGIGRPVSQAVQPETYHQQADTTTEPTDLHGLLPVGQAESVTPRSPQQLYDPKADTRRSALTNVRNVEKVQGQKVPESRPQPGQAPPMVEPCDLWIGNIPPNTSKGAMRHVLQSHAGFVESSDLFVRSIAQYAASKYAFATFENRSYAEEALSQIPKSQLDGLQGRPLKANWAKQRPSTPKHNRYRNEGYHGNSSMKSSPAKSDEVSKARAHQSRAPSTGPEDRHMNSKGSPVKSRKPSNAEVPRSGRVSDHRRKKSGGSEFPQQRSNTSVANKATEKAATASNNKGVEDKANSKLGSVSPSSREKFEDRPTMTEHNANAESGSEVAQSTTEVNDHSTPSHFGLSENVNPAQVSHRWAELFASDGVEDTAPSARKSWSSHKATQSSSSNKAIVPESKADSPPQCPPTPQKTKPVSKKPISNNGPKSKRKSPASGHNNNQEGQAKSNSSKVSATVGTSTLPKEDAHSRRTAFNSSALESNHMLQPTAGTSSHTPEETRSATLLNPPSSGQKPEFQATSKATPESSHADTFPVPSMVLTSVNEDNPLDRVKKGLQLPRANSQDVSLNKTKFLPPNIGSDQSERETQASTVLLDSRTGEGNRPDKDGPARASDPKVSKFMENMAPAAIASEQKTESLVILGDGTTNTNQETTEEASVGSPARSPKAMNIFAHSRSPQQHAAPEIPQRSSSLTESSTPIKTHKKKVRRFSPLQEDSGGATGQERTDETVLEHSVSVHINLPSERPSPVLSSLLKEDTMSKSRKRRSKQSRRLTPSIIVPAEQSTSPGMEALPKPETLYHTNDGGSDNTYNTTIPEGKALPKPETPFITDDGGNLLTPKLRSPLQSMPSQRPTPLNEPLVTSADVFVAIDYQGLQHNRGYRISERKIALSDENALLRPEGPSLSDDHGSELPSILSSGETDGQRPHRQNDPFDEFASKSTPTTPELPSVQITGSAVDHSNDQYLKCVPGGTEATLREVSYQSLSYSRSKYGPLLTKAATALEYTHGPAENGEPTEYRQSEDVLSYSWLEAAVHIPKPAYDFGTDSPLLSPENVHWHESILINAIECLSLLPETDKNTKHRREAEYLLKISPGQLMSEPQSEFMMSIVDPESWINKVREYMSEQKIALSRPDTDSKMIAETSPLLAADVECLEWELRRIMDETSMRLDSERQLGHSTKALHVNDSKLESLVSRTPRFLSSSTRPELDEWIDEANRWIATSRSLFKQSDSVPTALAAINAKIADLESKKSQQILHQKPRQPIVTLVGEGVPAPSSSLYNLRQHVISTERAGSSRSSGFPDDIQKLAAAVETKENKSRLVQVENQEKEHGPDQSDPDGSDSHIEYDLPQVPIVTSEPEIAEISKEISGLGQIRVQEDVMEEIQVVNNEGTGSATITTNESTSEYQDVDIDDSASCSTLKSDGNHDDQLVADTQDHDPGEREVSKAEDTYDDCENMRVEELQAQEEKHEATPVVPPSEIRRRHSIIENPSVKENPHTDLYSITEVQEGLMPVQEGLMPVQEGLMPVQELDNVYDEEEQNRLITIPEAEEVLTAPTAQISTTATDKDAACASDISEPRSPAPNLSVASTTTTSDSSDAKSKDDTSVSSAYDEQFPQLGLKGAYAPGRGRGRTQSYVAALATAHSVPRGGRPSQVPSRGLGAAQADGAGDLRRGSSNTHVENGSADGVWDIPKGELAWGRRGRGV